MICSRRSMNCSCWAGAAAWWRWRSMCMNPETSNIFTKYPTFQKKKKAMEFLCNGLRPDH